MSKKLATKQNTQETAPTSIENVKAKYHPGGSKRLSELVDDFQLTMQHALRQNLKEYLRETAESDAVGLSRPLTDAEQFDYLIDSDTEFLNYCFPYCAFYLSPSTMTHIHGAILRNFRQSLEAEVAPQDAMAAQSSLTQTQ